MKQFRQRIRGDAHHVHDEHHPHEEDHEHESRTENENTYTLLHHSHGDHVHFNLRKKSDHEHSHDEHCEPCGDGDNASKKQIGKNDEGCPCCAAAIDLDEVATALNEISAKGGNLEAH